MKYSIGEVSSLLNLSREMIRYYEKQGAIKASRNAENNYRSYDSMEVFWLLEAIQHKSWGIPISGITDIRANHFARNIREYLEERIAVLESREAYLSLLADRLKQVKSYAALGQVNIGNFWVTEMPAVWRCHLVTGRGDDYDRITLKKEESAFIFSDERLPFFDSGLMVREHGVDWEMSIEEHYLTSLGDTPPGSFVRSPASMALCTHLDIGEIGDFHPEIFQVLPDYAASHGYTVPRDALMQGFLLCRGYEDGRFRRLVRMYLPVV